MQEKAQAEFALILGLLIIAAVVGLYAYSAIYPISPQQAALTEDQKAVASFVNDFIRGAATSTVSEMYKNGGYLDDSLPAMGYVSHSALGKKVALWQLCESYNVPDIEQEFAKGVKKYIEKNMPDSQSIGGRTAVFGKQQMTVSSKLYDNKVTLSVNVPTTFEGSALPQPYTVDVFTKLGRIYDFAKNFARMQADCRVLDNNLLLSLAQSGETSRPCWIPIVGSAERSHTFTWTNLRDCMEMHAKYSLSNTLLGEEYPLRDDKIPVWALESFPVPAIINYDGVAQDEGVCSGTATADSKKYDDLSVNFYFGDDNGLDRNEFSAPDYLRIQPKVGPFTRYLSGLRVAEYMQTYSVRYPVIVNVWDSSMEKSFKFSVFVFLDNNKLGSCSTVPQVSATQGLQAASYVDRCDSRATEDANIMIRYTDGSPVVGATVNFFGCDLGTTGSGLPIQVKIPPVWGSLTVRDGRNDYVQCYSYETLANALVTIPRSKKFTFKFHTVSISKSGSVYTIDSISDSDSRVEVVMSRSGDSCSPPEPESILNLNSGGSYVSELEVSNLPVDRYDLSVATYDEQSVLGFINMTAFTPSGSELNIYAPSVSGFAASDLDNLRNLYESCGIDPVTPTSYVYSSMVGCSWTA